MQKYISIVQIIVAIILIVFILLQRRGSGLGAAFGGGGEAYSTRRGAEKFLFIATIVLAIIFFGLAFLQIVLI